MTLSPQWLDELRTRVSLSAVIGRSTRLIRAGREFKACCPFHEEKTPSFTVNDDKGFYHCFGCGAHGDVIRWMTDQRGLAFMDAVRELAAEAGLELPAPDPRESRQAEKRHGLDEVMRAAQDWFAANLRGPPGAEARRYLAERGFSPETIEFFGFGYASGGRQALREALGRFPEGLLVEAGLRIVVDEREPYDRFRNRIMLPIRDPRERIVAFGGRILDSDATDAPKYLNSPDTPLFDKGRTLFNLDRAGPIARKSGRLLVVEGYMDVVALAAVGIEDVVAPLGTALTEAHVELLWRVCEAPVLCFDGDAAGQRAARRAMQRALPLLRPARSLRIARLPNGLDPDDLVRAQGAGAMLAVVEHATPLVEALWEAERDALPLATPEDKAGLKARLMERAGDIADRDVRTLYRRELLARFDAFAWGRGPRRSGSRTSRFDRAAPSSLGGEQLIRPDALLAGVIAGLLRHPGELAGQADALARLRSRNRALSALLDLLIELGDSGRTLDRQGIQSILAERRLSPPNADDYAGLRLAFLTDEVPSPPMAEDLAKAINLLIERPAVEAAIAKATERFAEDPDGAIAELTRLRKRKLEFEQQLLQRASARMGDAGIASARAE